MLGVETHTFLPDQQSDRCNLACQGEACHRRLHPLGNGGGVELLEWSSYGSGSGRRALEDILQFVIVIGVKPALALREFLDGSLG